MILPAARGFWPAFWTWQAAGVDRHVETDVYEYWSDNPRRLYGHQFSGAGARCEWVPPFHPADGWHTYGVAIEPTGTTWYVDGVPICRTTATSDGPTAIISNLAVYSRIPPEPGTAAAVKQVDYIRAWFRSSTPAPSRSPKVSSALRRTGDPPRSAAVDPTSRPPSSARHSGPSEWRSGPTWTVS